MLKEEIEDNTIITPEEIDRCIAVLAQLNTDTDQIFDIPKAQRIALLKEAGRFSRPDRDEFSRRIKDGKEAAKRKKEKKDKTARKETGIRHAREASIFVAPKLLSYNDLAHKEQLELETPRNCYVCKTKFTKMHHFYDTMCSDCGDFNYAKRFQTADVKGQVAVITGSRLKIHGLDLRHIPSVEIFCNFIEQKYERLDILINNAAQTVRRPAGFYTHLMENEERVINTLPRQVQDLLQDHTNCLDELKILTSGASPNQNMPVTWHGPEPGIGLRASAKLSQIPYSFDNALVANEVFPEGELDADLQQVDLRKTNSWRLRLGQIETTEMIEVQLVNSVAPFVLCNRLSEVMKKENTGQKHIINVSAMEGKFHRFFKEDRHPHTNMAKAALNMLTHTSSGTLAKHGIFMNAVDTGWVTDEDPAELAKKKQEQEDFQPPLDIVDGAARVMDPLFDGINTGKHWCGKFLKDYNPIPW